MMTKKRSAAWTWLKVAFAIPAFFSVLLIFTAGSVNSLTAQTTEQQVKSSESQSVKTQDASNENEQVFVKVEKMPSFPGGDEALIKYLAQNIKYPEEAKTKGIQGGVFITFIVEADGSISNVKVLRGIGSGCDEEAVRVISSMPKWTPGMQKGETVRVQYNIPIQFKLDDKGKKKEEEKK